MKSYAKAAILLITLAIVSFSCASSPPIIAGDVQGIIFDFGKTPLSGALITLVSELTSGSMPYSSESDSRGRFTIGSVPSGHYSLQIRKKGYESRNWDVDISNYSEVIYVQISSYWQLLDAATLAIGDREWGKAQDFLSRAKNIESQTITEFFLEAVLLERKGENDAAMENIKAAITIDDKSAYLWLYLADLYERKKDSAHTISALQKYLSYKSDPSAKERLDTLIRNTPN